MHRIFAISIEHKNIGICTYSVHFIIGVGRVDALAVLEVFCFPVLA